MELWLAWQKIKSEIDAGNLGPEFERSELNTVAQQIRNAEMEAIEEAHASYRFISLETSRRRAASRPSTWEQDTREAPRPQRARRKRPEERSPA